MPHILIIESNTAALSQALRAMGGLSYGDQFKQALQAIDPGVTVSVAAPYEGDAVASLTGFDAVVFTGSGVDWTTDDARAEPLRALMRRVFAAGLPSFGSCNGVLLAASVLGGQTGASSKGRE